MDNIIIPENIRQFFKLLFKNDLVEIRPFGDTPNRWKGIDFKNRGWFTVPDLLERLPSLISDCKRKHNGVFFGVLPRSEEGAKQRKGTAKFCLPGRAVWADIDIKDLEGGWQEAEDLIAGLPVSPSAIVRSGGGFHIYYILKEATDPGKIEQFNQHLFPLVRGDNAAYDMARVLRLPGSWHMKDPWDPKKVELLTEDLKLHDFNNLVSVFGAKIHEWGSLNLSKKRKNGAKKLKTETSKTIESPVSKPSVCPIMIDLFKKNPRLENLFHGRGKTKGNTTKSGYDFSFAYQALRLGATIEQTERALGARALAGGGSRWQDLRYLENTVRNANDSLESWREQQKELKTIENPDKNIRLEKLNKSLSNVVRILQEDQDWKDRIRYNEFKGRLELDGERFIDSNITRIRMFLEKEYFSAPKDMVEQAVDFVARENVYHPVREWLEGLRWDGESRLRTWIERYVGVEPVLDRETGEIDQRYDELIREISAISLIANVARIMSPGAKVDQSVLLTGPQGVGKSSIIRELAYCPDWFRDTALDMRGGGSRDTYTKLRGVWLYELPEMASIYRARDMESVKAFLTSTTDCYREAYARYSVEVFRQNTFWITSNRSDLFTDSENRRFLPVEVRGVIERCGHWMVDLEGLREVVPLLYAEALVMYRDGVPWQLSKNSQIRLKELHAKHTIEDPWVSAVMDYVKNHPSKDGYSASELLTDAIRIPTDKQSKSAVMRLAELLQGAGWQKRRVWIHINRKTKKRRSRWFEGGA